MKCKKVTKFFFNYEGKEPKTHPLAPFFQLQTLNGNLVSLFCLDHGDFFPKAVRRVLEVQEYTCFVDIPIPDF